MFKNYNEVRDWLENFIPYTYSRQNLGLSRIEYLLKLLGNPEKKFKSILVGGTSGKGSTAFYLAKLLEFSENSENSVNQQVRKLGKLSKSAGQKTRHSDKTDDLIHRYTESSEYSELKVGLHLSPHLIDIRERLQINGKLIPMSKFIKLIEEIETPVGSMEVSKVGLPSYFEILVAASFKYFADEKVDWAVVEVGLGGRLDATNVLIPQACVITNVGLDHTEILGKTIEKIAWEKAGIIKGTEVSKVSHVSQVREVREVLEPQLVITGAEGKALEIIEEMAREKKARLIKLDTQLEVEPLKTVAKDYLIIYRDIERYIGKSFVSSNFLLALTTVLALGFRPSKKAILKVIRLGLAGRFEEIDSNVILDGAHNPDKIRFLIEHIKTSIDYRRSTIVLILAFKKGKDWKKMIDLLLGNLPVKKVIATKFNAVTDTGRFTAVEPGEIVRFLKSIVNRRSTIVEKIDNSQEAVFSALNANSLDANQLILVTGSLYLVGEARTLWELPKF